jgi:hypothetical protein
MKTVIVVLLLSLWKILTSRSLHNLVGTAILVTILVALIRISNHFDDEFFAKVKQSISYSAKGLEISTNGVARIVKNQNDFARSSNEMVKKFTSLLDEEAKPLVRNIDTNQKSTFHSLESSIAHLDINIDRNLKSSDRLVNSLEKQITNNGEEISFLLMDSRDHLNRTVVNVNQAIDGIKITTNDPEFHKELKDSLVNMNSLAGSLSANSKSIEVVTKNAADLSDHYFKPIINEKAPKGFFNKSLYGLKKAGKIALGFGNFFYIIERVK